jgi:hypothetical protein
MSLAIQNSRLPHGLQSLLVAVLILALSPPLYSVSSVAADPVSLESAALADPMTPIVVGPRELVGKPSLGEKATASAIGGLVGGVFGSSGRKSSQPKTLRDPTRKLDYNNFAAESFDTETQVRSQWTKDGLLVSSRIEDSPGKGTFQAIFLEACDGRRMYPQRYEIYDLWNESSLSVSWSKTSTSNGNVVSQQSGGWSDSWSQDFSGFTANAEAAAGEASTVPGTWQQLGFDRAQGGVRQIGAYFNLSPQALSEMGETAIIVHTTRPLQDPVSTSPAQWVIAPGSDKQPALSAANRPEGTSAVAQPWQMDSPSCQQQKGILLASAGQPGPGAEPFEGVPRPPPAQAGFPIPAGIQFISVKGTGRTTGYIANLSVKNTSSKPISLPTAAFYIPATGKYQSYVGRPGQTPAIPAGVTQTIPIYGYCGDVHKPPVPEGVDMPPPINWIVAGGPISNINIPPRAGAGAAGRAMVPGTDIGLPRAISGEHEPLLVAPLLLAAMTEIEKKTAELQASGDLHTPFSGNPEREREAVIQQTMWIYAAEVEGESYTKEDFTERMEQQYEDRSGVPITAAKAEDRERLQQGADDFWDAFELVGLEAKVINHPEPAAPAGTAAPTEAKAAPVPGQAPPPEKVADDGCKGHKHIHHTDRLVDVKISDSYGNAEDRKKISDGIRESVASEESAYVTSTPPSTAYSIWRDDAIGGISSAYAKSVFLEKNDQEWVWSTEPLKTTAKGTGTHTLSYQPGPNCTAHVAGAALMWIKSSSEAFDPLANSIEVFRALDAVKELSVKYAIKKLPPGLDDAVEAGVDAITDPASDTYAAANGQTTLVVGGHSDGGISANRVVYKRKDKEDKAIIGGGATVKKFFASDVLPNSLTSKIDASVVMEAGATGNGFAKAYLESVYGTLLVGICECPSGTSYEILSDAQMFIRTDAAKGAVDVALRDMQAAVDRISKDIESGAQDTDRDKLKKRVEDELRSWGNSQAGERFQPKEGTTMD